MDRSIDIKSQEEFLKNLEEENKKEKEKREKRGMKLEAGKTEEKK